MNDDRGFKPNERPDMFKTAVDQNNLPSNYIYGIDTNDKDEVRKEYLRLKNLHIRVTIFSAIVLAVLAIFIFDFVRVNMWDQKPMFGIKKKVDGGIVYKGLGYNALYCDSGKVYKVNIERETCEEYDKTFRGILLKNLKIYLRENNYINISNLKTFEFEDVVFDEYNNYNKEEGSDYLVDLHFECSDGSTSCMKTFKEFPDPNHVRLYLVVSRDNDVVEVKTFKNSGAYYEKLKEEYTEKVKTYMIENELADEENLRWFMVDLFGNRGQFKYDGVLYSDSYMITIHYLCHDNTNTCVQRFDNSADFSNLMFEASMFIDENGDVANLRSVQVIE